MKILVLSEAYPKDNDIKLFYVHTRNKIYQENNIDVTVINFQTNENYYIEGIRVITEKNYSNDEKFDLVIAHAANLKNHYRFLKKHNEDFSNIILFFHGHEILVQNEVYSKPYSYMKKDNLPTILIQNLYDKFKISIWRNYILKNKKKLNLVFVSSWMENMFLKFTKIKKSEIEDISNIIYNSIGNSFENEIWDKSSEKKYDLLTIRGNLDGSKYCIDIINQLAFNNPNLKFKLFGKGKFFEFNNKAPNIDFEQRSLNHSEIIEQLNQARVALLPTRTDAQGVMACEVQATGIPLITSKIDVCEEVFGNEENVLLIDNDELLKLKNLDTKIEFLEINYKEKYNKKYYVENTTNKEIDLFNKILRRSNENK